MVELYSVCLLYTSHDLVLKWSQVEKRLRALIKDTRYLNPKGANTMSKITYSRQGDYLIPDQMCIRDRVTEWVQLP